MATTNDLKNGLVLNLDGQLWSVVEFQHVKPGKGPAFVRTKLKNVVSGKTVDKTFNAGVKVETSNVDKRTMQYLYKDGSDFVFMDTDTYDQIHVPEATVGSAANYMLENQNAIVASTRARRSTSSCRRRSSSRSPSPSRASRATAPPAARSRPHSRRARRSRCPSSSRPAPRSRSTRATGRTSAASTTDRLGRTHESPVPRPRHPLRGRPARTQRGGAARRAAPRLRDLGVPRGQQPLHRRAGAGSRREVGRHQRRAHRLQPGLDDRADAGRRPGDPAGRRWEVLFNDDIPDAVAISEAVALATELSTDESPTFVNGLLARLSEVKATIV